MGLSDGEGKVRVGDRGAVERAGDQVRGPVHPPEDDGGGVGDLGALHDAQAAHSRVVGLRPHLATFRFEAHGVRRLIVPHTARDPLLQIQGQRVVGGNEKEGRSRLPKCLPIGS